jgi:hypothetical protein
MVTEDGESRTDPMRDGVPGIPARGAAVHRPLVPIRRVTLAPGSDVAKFGAPRENGRRDPAS